MQSDYPSLSRKDLMSLSTIKKEEIFGRTTHQFSTKDIMRTQDVEGSRPEIHGYRFSNKETFNLKNDDIIGSQSRKLYQGNIKYNYSLETNDILGIKLGQIEIILQTHKFIFIFRR